MVESPIYILYIDDEPNNVVSFRATFRREFNVFATVSVAEAFSILEKEPINIIISDQKMPEMTGTEFFAKVVEQYPDPIRMLLTGFADLQAVIDAMSAGISASPATAVIRPAGARLANSIMVDEKNARTT